MVREIKDNVCLIFSKNWTHTNATDQRMSMSAIFWSFNLIFAKESFGEFLPNINLWYNTFTDNKYICVCPLVQKNTLVKCIISFCTVLLKNVLLLCIQTKKKFTLCTGHYFNVSFHNYYWNRFALVEGESINWSALNVKYVTDAYWLVCSIKYTPGPSRLTKQKYLNLLYKLLHI